MSPSFSRCCCHKSYVSDTNSSVSRLLASVARPLASVARLLASVARLLTSVARLLVSVARLLVSVARLLVSVARLLASMSGSLVLVGHLRNTGGWLDARLGRCMPSDFPLSASPKRPAYTAPKIPREKARFSVIQKPPPNTLYGYTLPYVVRGCQAGLGNTSGVSVTWITGQ
jgi:hypothetical protein